MISDNRTPSASSFAIWRAREIAKSKSAIALIQQTELREFSYHVARQVAQRGNLIDRVSLMDGVRDGLADPFEKAALTRHWNAISIRATKLVRRTTVVQQWPTQLANNQ